MLTLKEKIGVIVGSRADLRAVKLGLMRMKRHEIPFRLLIVPPLQLDALKEWLRQAVDQGIQVFIVAQGGSALLPGFAAAHVHKPVIAVPLDTSPNHGDDALGSLAALPDGMDLVSTGLNDFRSALRTAVRILATSDDDYAETCAKIYDDLLSAQRDEELQLRQEFDDVLGDGGPRTMARKPFKPDPEEIAKAKAMQQGKGNREDPLRPAPKSSDNGRVYTVNAEDPDYSVIELAAEALLAGKVVCFPTETVYGLAADATNTKAVQALAALKGRRDNHPFTLMICNDQQLFRITARPPHSVVSRLDSFWPGPLTLVFEKAAGAFEHISADETIGIRIPDHLVALSILSAVDRPLAVTSANPSSEPPATTASRVLTYFPGDAPQVIVDGGPTISSEVSTVIRVTEEPFEILREGSISRDQLREIYGEEMFL
ncbi:threonylcarbamoyl-AMP synthase [Candidatus Sumerlaeota bacterium]|nr:threonylcarbamoyl-AMP synthase [Candidatus Sumerlaeota bacterium]